jgi:sucrose phosphorylase
MRQQFAELCSIPDALGKGTVSKLLMAHKGIAIASDGAL